MMKGMRVSVLVICAAVSTWCHPSRPLNERSPELAWQAWLLVDDQNQPPAAGGGGKHDGEVGFKRRITPKSVFIAPTFSPQDLPPCAEGYASDPMGRCMKIFKIDEDAHLHFLLDKLNEKFGGGADLEYSDEDEGEDAPLQFNIPLGLTSDETKQGDGEETEMAIVVAPTNSNFNQLGTAAKLDKKTELSLSIDTRLSETTEASTTTEEADTTITTTTTTTTEEFPTETTTTQEGTTTEELEDVATTLTTTIGTTLVEDETTSTATTTPLEMESTTEIPSTTTTTKPVASRIRFPLEQDDSSAHRFVRFPIEQQRDYRQLTERPNFSKGPAKTALEQPRDLHMPDKWSSRLDGATLNKPLVMRFSRKNSYVDSNLFKRPDFYRALPSNDLSYIFGFRNRRQPKATN